MSTRFLLLGATLLFARSASAVIFTVNSTGDAADTNTGDGVCDSDNATPGLQCTLRAAIAQANATAGPDIIAFNIPPAGAKTITPGSKLPNVNEAVTIDGTTQPGFTTSPIIEINGANQGPFQALDIFAPSTIRGLVINRLVGGSGIVLWAGSGGSVIEGCYIGTDLTGTQDFGNSFNGIIVRSAGNRIGGTTVPQRNVISGNTSPGIALDTGASNTLVQGNFIGTNAAGTVALGNTDDNILVVNGASNNTIGGTDGVTLGGPCSGACNVVSGSLNSNGIALFGSNVTGNVVIGNYIGTDVTGTQDLGNAGGGAFGGNGIYNQAPGTRIGGPTPQERNVISGNSASGIFLDAAITTGVRIEGNFIGMQVDGVTPLPNARGVLVEEAVSNFIGGTATGTSNLIAGNTVHGVEIRNGASANRVEGNSLGTNPAGKAVIPNGGVGILVNNSNDTAIGGTAVGAANRIAHNGGNGVTVIGTSARTSIRQNRIHENGGLGIDLAGDGATPNDPGDGDSGPNDLMNFPEGVTATYNSTTNETVFRGRLDTPNPETVAVELFTNLFYDATNHGEGGVYRDTVTPNPDGTFCLTVSGANLANPTATATNAAGSTSEFSARSEVVLIALEVNQAVQDWTNSVRLIEDKGTYVRAHLQTVRDFGPNVAVAAQLRGFQSGVELPGSPLTPVNFGGFQAKPNAASRRATWNDSLNFRLPPQWLAGDVELRFERSDGGSLACREPGDAGGPAGQCSDCRAKVTFVYTDPAKVKLVAINHTEGGTSFHFGLADLDQVARIVTAMYPIANLDWIGLLHDWTGTIPVVDDDVTAKMKSLRAWDLWPNRVYYGVIPSAAGYAGVADAIPSKAASGFIPDTFFGYGRATPPHEIGHTLGRAHSVDGALFGLTAEGRQQGACGEKGANPPQSGVFPSFFAVASPSPFTDAGVTLQPTFGPMSSGDDALVYGLDTSTAFPKVMDPNVYFELMSYCGVTPRDMWISKHTYEGLQTSIHNTFAAWAGKKAALAGPQTFLIVRGTVDLRTGAVSIAPLSTLTTAVAPEGSPAGAYTLRLLNASDGLIGDIPFAPAKLEPRGPDPELATFFVPVPSNPAIRKVVVLLNSVPLATRAASANAPTVQVLSPNGGETLASDPVALSWFGTDADADPLLYLVQYSPDGGASWETLLVDHPAQTATIPRSAFKATANGLIRVIATDGFLTAQDESNAAFSVSNHAPFVSLFRPTAGEMFAGDQQIVFEALGRDVEDGELPGGSLQWTSNINGVLGAGRTLLRRASELTAGNHTITVTGTDTATATGFASVSIQVGAAAPPSFADLALEQATSPEPAVAGNNLIYTLRVVHEAGDTATGVTLADTLPAGAGFVSANASQGSCGQAADVVTCNLGSLAEDASATITIVVTPPSAGTITNTATVTGGLVDPTPANNSSMLDTVVDARGITDLAIEKTDSIDPVPLGGALTYTLQVTNLGGNTAKLVTVSDPLPAGVAYVASSGSGWTCNFTSGTVTCTRPSLGVGAAPPITIAVTAPSGPGSILNTASVSFADPDSASGNNSESETTQVGGVGPAPANFHTLTPCRIADTREPDGAFGGPALAAGLQRAFTVAGRCGIPATAKAVSFNVTITGPTSLGHISLYPGGTALPLVSTMNFSPGQTRANNAIIPLGAGGTLAVTSGQGSGTVHFILDTNGYFE